MFWNKVITLYNKYEDEQTGLIKWYRHVLQNCFYKVTDNTVNVGGMQLQTNDNIIRIPAQPNYIAPHMWLELQDAERDNYMTLKSGDLIVLGVVDTDIDEYTSGKRSSDLIAKYKTIGSVFVKSVNINDFMCGPHYYVRGV